MKTNPSREQEAIEQQAILQRLITGIYPIIMAQIGSTTVHTPHDSISTDCRRFTIMAATIMVEHQEKENAAGDYITRAPSSPPPGKSHG